MKYLWSDSDDQISLVFTQVHVDACSHAGECYHDCSIVVDEIKKQLDKYSSETIKNILLCTGGWEEEDLTIKDENHIKLIWIACNDIKNNPEIYLPEE